MQGGRLENPPFRGTAVDVPRACPAVGLYFPSCSASSGVSSSREDRSFFPLTPRALKPSTLFTRLPFPVDQSLIAPSHSADALSIEFLTFSSVSTNDTNLS